MNKNYIVQYVLPDTTINNHLLYMSMHSHRFRGGSRGSSEASRSLSWFHLYNNRQCTDFLCTLVYLIPTSKFVTKPVLMNSRSATADSHITTIKNCQQCIYNINTKLVRIMNT